MTDTIDLIIDFKPRKKTTRLKKRLLKKDHEHAGRIYYVGTPLENLKASDSVIEFLKKRDIV